MNSRIDSKKLSYLLWEVVLSTIVFALGIISSYRFYSYLGDDKEMIRGTTFLGFLSLFAVGTIMLILVNSFLKKKKNIRKNFYKIIFFVANIYGALTIIPVICELLSIPAIWGSVLTIILTVVLFFEWHKKPTIWNHNLLMILGLAGVGGIFGLELGKPEIVAGLLAVLTVYDFIAVYKTKHMVKMAESMIETQIILGLVIPSDRKEFIQSVPNNENRGKFIILGGGDLAMPLILATSFIPFGLEKSIIVAIFSLLGIVLSFCLVYSQEEKRVIPALPAISFMSLIGCLLAIAF